MTEEKTKSLEEMLEERANALRIATNEIFQVNYEVKPIRYAISGRKIHNDETLSIMEAIQLVYAQNNLITTYLQEIYKEIKNKK